MGLQDLRFSRIFVAAFAVTLLLSAGFLGDFFMHEDALLLYQAGRALGGQRSLFAPVLGTCRPVYVLYFCILRLFGGLHPGFYHGIAAALHALNSALIFALLRRLSRDLRWAFAAAALFLVYGRSVEARYYIAGIDHVLMLLFGLLGFLALENALGARTQKTWWVASAVLFLMAIGAKNNAVVFAPLMLARVAQQKPRWRKALLGICLLGGIAAAAGGFALLRTARFSMYAEYIANLKSHGRVGLLQIWQEPVALFLPLEFFKRLSLTPWLKVLAAGVWGAWIYFAWHERRVGACLAAFLIMSSLLVMAGISEPVMYSRHAYAGSVALTAALALMAKNLRSWTAACISLMWLVLQIHNAYAEIQSARVQYHPELNARIAAALVAGEKSARPLLDQAGGLVLIGFPRNPAWMMQSQSTAMIRLFLDPRLSSVFALAEFDRSRTRRWLTLSGEVETPDVHLKVQTNSSFIDEIPLFPDDVQRQPVFVFNDASRERLLFSPADWVRP